MNTLLIGINSTLCIGCYHCLLHETWGHPPGRALWHHWAFPAYFYRRPKLSTFHVEPQVPLSFESVVRSAPPGQEGKTRTTAC